MSKQIDRSAFLYFSPRGLNRKQFAQCGTCGNFEGHRCAILPKDFPVAAADSCGMYLPGKANGTHPAEPLTPKEVGFVARPVRCENCRYFSDGQCELYWMLNAMAPDTFKLDTNVNALGCCNAQSAK